MAHQQRPPDMQPSLGTFSIETYIATGKMWMHLSVQVLHVHAVCRSPSPARMQDGLCCWSYSDSMAHAGLNVYVSLGIEYDHA